jgi:plasmid stabilization system protein ParE
MAFRVRMTGRARSEFRKIIAWLAERSLDGAARLEDAFNKAAVRLTESPESYPQVPEFDDLAFVVREIPFSTRRGRTYRAFFTIEGDVVWILHLRGPGQAPMTDVVPPTETD